MRGLALLGALAVLAAGCVTPAAPPAQGGADVATAAPTGGDGAALALATAAGFVLHLQPDLTLAAASPAEEGSVTLTTPVNGPETPGYPVWSGTLPSDVNLTGEGVAVTFFATSNSASLRANLLPVFSDLPGFYVVVTVGDKELGAEAEGPEVMHVGHEAQVDAVASGDTGRVPAGAEVSIQLVPIYSHVTTAAEVRFLMGPEHPARIAFGASASV